MKRAQYKTVDEYFHTLPRDIQHILQTLRQTIRKSAPEANEKISYQIPTFVLSGNLVHFAAFKNHIGFYPHSSAIAHFKKELSRYETAKGTIRFPINKPLPLTLISRMVRFRVEENLARKKGK